MQAFMNFYDQTSSFMDASLALTYLLSIQSYWPVNSSGFLSGVLGMGLDQKKPKSPSSVEIHTLYSVFCLYWFLQITLRVI